MWSNFAGLALMCGGGLLVALVRQRRSVTAPQPTTTSWLNNKRKNQPDTRPTSAIHPGLAVLLANAEWEFVTPHE